MLELKNIYKTYRTKGAPPVAALVDVSLRLENHGMVFVLGKSGSGKSTFLNVVGGLDKADSGEIIVKGKSSGEFSGSDFDSYRNTYLGFVFQEYNIIEEFTIGQNLSLALELQQRKAMPADVDSILKKVDLEGYSDRSPNQISGGQRQRVAIARALIKDPEIIMADEPTGALDSTTGEQIFETLKSLSQDKLVIVVSHDREYAELYGDRIIEFKDGRIVSDMIKADGGFDEQIKTVDGALVRDRLIKIPAGTALTAQHSKLIEQLSQSGEDIIISTDQGLNRYFDDSFKVTKQRKGGFEKTRDDKLDLSKNATPFKLIKSRLPAKSAIKMARSSMKHKRGRLAFSIILAVLAITFFGFSSVVGNFSERTVVGSVMRDNGYNYIGLSKNICLTKGIDPNFVSVAFDEGERAKIDSIVDGATGTLIFRSFGLPTANNTPKSGYNASYFNTTTAGYVISDNLDKMGFDIPEAYGRYPQKDNEILITNYMAQSFLAYGLTYYENGKNKTMYPQNINDVLNYTINVYGSVLKIVGIINFRIERYKDYLFTNTKSQMSSALSKEFDEHIQYELSYVYGLPGLKNFLGYTRVMLDWVDGSTHFNLPGMEKSDIKGHIGAAGKVFSSWRYEPNLRYLGADGSTVMPEKLEQGEIVLDLANYNYFKKLFAGEDMSGEVGNGNNLSMAQLSALAENLGVFNPDFKLKATFYVSYFMADDDIYYQYDESEYTVVGVASTSSIGGVGVFNDEDFLRIQLKGEGECVFAYAKDNSTINNLMASFVGDFAIKGRNDIELNYRQQMPLGDKISFVSSMFRLLAMIFFYMSLVFCLFAALLLLNFISTSVAYKRKEIGILRAIGARKWDVNSIFLWEGFFISLWIIAFAIVLVFVAVVVFNNLVGTFLGLPFTLLTFGVLDILLMAVVCIVTVTIASIFPVTKVSSMKPIDAIRGKN